MKRLLLLTPILAMSLVQAGIDTGAALQLVGKAGTYEKDFNKAKATLAELQVRANCLKSFKNGVQTNPACKTAKIGCENKATCVLGFFQDLDNGLGPIFKTTFGTIDDKGTILLLADASGVKSFKDLAGQISMPIADAFGVLEAMNSQLKPVKTKDGKQFLQISEADVIVAD